MKENLHAGHRQRVREKFMQSGLDSFNDVQIVELLLFYCVPRRDTNELAHILLNEFGTLHNLLEADPLDIMRRTGLSESAAVFLSLIPQVTMRYSKSKWDKRQCIDTSKKAGEYAVSLYYGKTVECFYLICLDKQQNLIHAELMNKGTTDAAPVYPRQIVEVALKHRASYVLITHNHPGGSLEPSHDDIVATKKIIKALKTVDIFVIDHIIVAGEAYLSFSEKKIFPKD